MHRACQCLALAVVLLCASAAAAQDAEKSLNKCQDTVRKAGQKFVAGELKAIGDCLKKVAKNVLKDNIAVTTSTATGCVKAFRKINDTRALGKSLPEKLAAKITEKCDPASPDVAHTLDDIRGEGAPGVAEQIETKEIEIWCTHFGGDGDIGSFAEWLACIQAAHECQARQGAVTQFPRAPEWLDDAAVVMAGLPVDPDDVTAIPDALAGLGAADAAIDSDGDDIPDIRCGGEGVACTTACCYVEQPPLAPAKPAPDAECFEYTGPPAQIAAFMTGCTLVGPGIGVPGSLAGPFLLNSVIPGPCLPPSPVFGLPCIPGPPTAGNLHVLPTDSSCP